MYSFKGSKGQWLAFALAGIVVMFLVAACAVPGPPVRVGWIRVCSASEDVYGEVRIDGEPVATLEPEACVRIDDVSYPKGYTIDLVRDDGSRDRMYVIVDRSGQIVNFH